MQYNASDPILLARWPHVSPGNYAFPDGGSAWILSKAAIDIWGPYIPECLDVEVGAVKARELLGPSTHPWSNCKDSLNPGLWCAEDIFLAYCLQKHGVRVHSYRGATGALMHLTHDALRHTLGKNFSQPHAVVLHPVDASEQRDLWDQERNQSANRPMQPESALESCSAKGGHGEGDIHVKKLRVGE